MLRGAVSLKLGKAALVPELHREAYDGAALLLQEGSNGGRVHSAGHGYRDEVAPGFGALGKGVELGCCAHANFIISGNGSICSTRKV